MTMQHTMQAMTLDTLDADLARATSAHPVEVPSVKSNYKEEMTRAGVVGPWDMGCSDWSVSPDIMACYKQTNALC